MDSTFATPLNQRPLSVGANISMLSATRFIGGHSDLLSGVGLRHTRELTGATPGALECFLAVRGVRTLALRLERAQQTAQLPITRYPGLPTHPTHSVARDRCGRLDYVRTLPRAMQRALGPDRCKGRRNRGGRSWSDRNAS